MVYSIFASSATMSATASAGDWYCSLQTYLFSRDKSTHMRSVPFLGCYRYWCTPFCYFCDRCYDTLLLSQSKSNSSFSFLCYANGTDCGALTQNGFAPSVNDMVKHSPTMVVTCPLNTVVYCLRSSVALLLLWVEVIALTMFSAPLQGSQPAG